MLQQHHGHSMQAMLNTITQSAQELMVSVEQIDKTLVNFSYFAPFFSMAHLQQRAGIDIAKIDQNYLLGLGRQLIQDYNLLKAQAQPLKARITQSCEVFLKLDPKNVTEEVFTNSLLEAQQHLFDLSNCYAEWSGQYERIITAGLRDVIGHINAALPVDSQIAI